MAPDIESVRRWHATPQFIEEVLQHHHMNIVPLRRGRIRHREDGETLAIGSQIQVPNTRKENLFLRPEASFTRSGGDESFPVPLLLCRRRFGPQQLLVEFADLFQCSLKSVIVLQTLFHMRGLLFAQTDLVHASARIANGENRNGMPATPIASLAAARAMTDIAIKQRPAEDIARIRKLPQKAVPLADDLLQRH